MKKFGGTLENWFEYKIEDVTVVFGEAINDPHGRFYPGQTMRTSQVCSIDRHNGIVETYYSKYQLGTENTSLVNVRAKLSLMFGGFETPMGTVNGEMHTVDMSRVVVPPTNIN